MMAWMVSNLLQPVRGTGGQSASARANVDDDSTSAHGLGAVRQRRRNPSFGSLVHAGMVEPPGRPRIDPHLEIHPVEVPPFGLIIRLELIGLEVQEM